MADYYREEDVPMMLTIQELAGFLRVSKNTAYHFVNTGKVPSVKVGHQIRIFRDNVIQYIKAQHP